MASSSSPEYNSASSSMRFSPALTARCSSYRPLLVMVCKSILNRHFVFQIELLDAFFVSVRAELEKMRCFIASDQACSQGSSQVAGFYLLFKNVRDAAATLGFRALAASAANCLMCFSADIPANLRAMELSICADLDKAEAAWTQARSALLRMQAPTSQLGATLVRPAATVGKRVFAVVVRRTLSR